MLGGANSTSVPGASKGTSVSDRAIQILGSLAGFGALTYGVGCAILWLRYQTTGFNADEALSVAPRGQIIFLGFRWIMGWALFVAALTALLVWVRAHALKVPGARFLNAWIIVAAESILVVVAFLFSTWSALTLAIDLLAITVFISWDELRGRRANRSQQPGESSASTVRTWRVGRTAIFVALIATFSAIGWQLEINLPYVAVQYRVVGQPTNYDGIYFGEVDGNFYIAQRPGRTGEFFRAISVYPAATVQSLMIRPGTRTLCTRVNRPLIAFGNFISRAWDAVEQHLRRTGQPNPSSGYTSAAAAKKLPRGFCPPLP